MLLDVSLYNDLSRHEIAGGFALIVVFYAIYKSLTRWRDPIVETRYLDKLEAEREALRAKGTPLSPPGRYCVVGAGFCGLGICAALGRWEFDYDCFEADDCVGGNWYHGVYETVHIISSRRTTEYKDLPMPRSFSEFPSKDEMFRYLSHYARFWDVKRHIRFNTKVAAVHPIEKGEQGYDVELEDGSMHHYKGVIIANGHHWDARWAGPYPGTFSGMHMHSKQYKEPSVLEGKRVLVVGGGNSACDIVAEAARFARSAHVSHRRGYWFLPRTMFGMPSVEGIFPWMPLWFQRFFIGLALRLVVGKYTDYGLKEPDHKLFDHHPTINSDLLNYIKLGRVTPHADIKEYDGHTVRFEDGSSDQFDLIVHATGYHVSIPLLSSDVLTWSKHPINGRTYPDLIEGMLIRDYKNLIVFGVGQPRYGAGPLITAGAEVLAKMLRIQEDLSAPLANVLHRLGSPVLSQKTNMVDPYLNDPHVVFTGALEALSALSNLTKLAKLFS